MINTLSNDYDVYCYLKQLLEPAFSVVAEPQAGYYAQWKYSYRIFDGEKQLAELTGDFRELESGGLVHQALTLIQQLSNTDSQSPCRPKGPSSFPIASRLTPRQTRRTWFSSGRAAFAWLLKNVVKPRRVYLPTFICWSLVDVMLQRFPDLKLEFYTVDSNLNCRYPTDLTADDVVVNIHYFGHSSVYAATGGMETVFEDVSHCFLPVPEEDNSQDSELSGTWPEHITRYQFGSLRKAYRVADGGFVNGAFCPGYEADPHLDAWLRLAAVDWRDLREAENMTDRQFRISDISSQSLAVVLSTNIKSAADRRRANNVFLNNNFDCGTELVDFADDEIPLLNVRYFDCTQERDSLRDYLATENVFTSIHWPVHEHLRQQNRFDTQGALWIERHSFAIPVAEDFGNEQMEKICNAAANWKRAGGARFPHLATG